MTIEDRYYKRGNDLAMRKINSCGDVSVELLYCYSPSMRDWDIAIYSYARVYVGNIIEMGVEISEEEVNKYLMLMELRS